MESRRVNGIQREDRRISAVCFPDSDRSPRSTEAVATDILDGRYRYLVGETSAVIRPVHREGRLYLRSAGDSSLENNLANLPLCDGEPVRGQLMSGVMRRNITAISNVERHRLVNAILALHQRYYSDGVSWWFKQDHIHQSTHVHGEPGFLPWHRELTNRFEALLQQIDPRVALHYWDWTRDPRTSGKVFTQGFMGSSDGEIGPPFVTFYNGGQQAGSRGQTQNPADPPRLVERKLPAWGPMDDPDPDFRVAHDWDVITAGDGEAQEAQFPAFRDFLTAIHGRAHWWIGGNIRNDHSSFEDPFVFLLHSNVDRLWAGWQLRRLGDQRLAAWRLDPSQIYGDDATNSDMTTPMEPWAGLRSADRNIAPWTAPENQQESKTATHLSIVNPPLYDDYGHNELCMSWPALRLRRQLPDGDIIHALIERDAVDSSVIEFAIEAGRNVTWWKMIRVPDGTGGSVTIWTEEERWRDSTRIPANQVGGQELIFHKAKFLGDRQIVYRLGGLGWLPPGSRVTFRWLRD